jgi:cytochrome c-type biogenesis protein CcsB
MKQIAGFLFSARLMAFIMAIFAVSIGVATFIENDFGSDSARTFVYNARWFEVLLLLGVINLTGRIFTLKLYRKEKFTIFLFHFSFIVILTGAGLTRYAGEEGSVSIREGQSTNQMLSDKCYIRVVTGNKNSYDFKTEFSPLSRNRFRKSFKSNDKSFTVHVKAFLLNAVETIEPFQDGSPVAEIIYSDTTGRKSLIISSGEIKQMGSFRIAFDTPANDSNIIRLSLSGDSIIFIANYPVTIASMQSQSFRILQENKPHAFIPQYLYTFNGQMIVLNQFYMHGRITAKSMKADERQTYNAVIAELISGKEKNEIILTGMKGYPGNSKTVNLNGEEITISYGSVYYDIPFKLKLNDFIIERYPGSQSPSSFESRVTLIDEKRNHRVSKRIYMNNILKYKGYRFYQSSYDADEMGTILSVNHDLAGTSITYTGYLLMAIGMILSFFNRNSRLRMLSEEINVIKMKKKAIAPLALVFLMGLSVSGQESIPQKTILSVSEKHAAEFGKLLIQDNNGRIEPINTLSSEVIRKLLRKSSYRGMNPDQVFLGMLSDPGFWQHEPLIRTTHPQIQKIIGSRDKYYPFVSFFRGNDYILQSYVEAAYRKKTAYRSKFDNEMIRLDERVNIAYLVFSGELLKLFPIKGDSSYTWYNHLGIKGKVRSADSVFTENIIYLYVQKVRESQQNGDWSGPDEIVNAISDYQKKNSGGVYPPPRKVNMEIFLNKADIFSNITRFYGLIGLLLLILQFIGIFYTRLKLKIPITISIVLIVIVFSIHTMGLGMRWYVSGHAPLSNGYEALTYIAWAAVLAGLVFAYKSSISLSVTSVLAFLILNVAHLSFMDPQITNLVPVLKSYWLVIHVATITASYGFLALGALMAFLNLILMILQNNNNKDFVKFTIQELSNIIEMALIIGLYLLTMGVFLGAVWANESWGRYWGWDPKETWALVTVLAYAFISHMRMIPGLKNIFAFNLAALLGIASVIMTYFGVNYYLSGLHSYAAGDPLPIPAFVYYSTVIVILTALIAYFRNRKTETVH